MSVAAKPLIKALRPHQWSKNLLVFVPLVTAHRFFDSPTIVNSVLAFLSFSFASSTVYVLNDLIDLESDRTHPTKQHRPFASGDLSPRVGVALVCFLIVPALFLAALTNAPTFLIVATYIAAAVSYSLYLKSIPVADIIMLAGFYSLRILAGGVATEIHISEWLLGFSSFYFLSLASMKRFIELSRCRTEQQLHAVGRGYTVNDLPFIETLGATAGYLSVVVFALYMTGDEVRGLYTKPQFLWLNSVIIFYWIARTWLLAHRGKVSEDPVIFALRDNVSYLLGFSALIVILLSL